MSDRKWECRNAEGITYAVRPDGSKAFFVDDDAGGRDDVQKFVDVMNGDAKKIDEFNDSEILEECDARNLIDGPEEQYEIDGMVDREKMDFLYQNINDIKLEDLEKLVSFNKAR